MPETAPENRQARLPAGGDTDAFSPWRHLDFKRRARLIGCLGVIALLILLFINPLFSLAIHAARSELHSYILLVPFVFAYLIYIRRTRLPAQYNSSPGLAVIPLVAGSAALAAGWSLRSSAWPLSHNDYLALMALSFVCFVAAGGFLFLGGKWMKAAAFPMAFLIFMIPMPDAMADVLETASMLASTEAANLLFNVTGTPVLREGTIFQLPSITIRVAQECSGIRSSWVLVITSLVAGNLFLKDRWRRAVLVCFVVPLGIVRNGFRVWLIGMLCVHIGPNMIHSIVHRRGGPIFFVLSLIPLFVLLWWLRRGETGRPRVTTEK